MSILVTGASKGIGLSVVSSLIDDNRDVIAQYRSTPPPLEHERLTWWRASFEPGATAYLPAAEYEAVVHCAGVVELGTCATLSEQAWRDHMEVNLYAPVRLTNMVLPSLRERDGHVIYINSGAGLHTKPEWGAYSASKFAARAWCDTLRAEEPKIRVTSIYPGRVDTDMQRGIVAYEGGEYDGSQFIAAQTIAQTVVSVLHTPRDAQVHDISIRPR
ncbi:SDR family oxidoreductase [Corynebacterium gerontici]|uniref:Putative oxidoreductase YciK n=1 Tax=Corynebacterium gerontici TaxID=2079234 RepID=A0A3G6J2W1_9CORY|nr:SDR family oxidoreductase [Corynebacterium gerontici]AZA12385.1 putative oxidoreductase YciK [Corynebacterium gerontici]